MIRDQDSILDHLQPSKLLDIWMHTQISRATSVHRLSLLYLMLFFAYIYINVILIVPYNETFVL